MGEIESIENHENPVHPEHETKSLEPVTEQTSSIVKEPECVCVCEIKSSEEKEEKEEKEDSTIEENKYKSFITFVSVEQCVPSTTISCTIS